MEEDRARRRESGDRASGAPVEGTELPTDKAFVLQLSRDTGPTLESFAGRVEHLGSGRRLRFESLAAFQAAVAQLLIEAQRMRDEREPGPPR